MSPRAAAPPLPAVPLLRLPRSLPRYLPLLRALVLALVFVLGLLCVPGPRLQALTYVGVSDEGLVDGSAAIVTGRIVDRQSVVLGTGLPWTGMPWTGMPWTQYRLQVDRVLEGSVDRTVLVRVPGGVRPDGIGAVLFGAPRFAPGDRVLLFLHPADDGTWRIRHLPLGAFHVVPRPGSVSATDAPASKPASALALRSLAGAHEVAVVDGRLQEVSPEDRERGPRSLPRFLAWIADRLRGELREADYFLPVGTPRTGTPLAGDASVGDEAGELRSRGDAFTLLERDGRRIRWFEFDEGRPVVWRAIRSQPGLSAAQRREALERGLAVWNGISGSAIRLELGDDSGGTLMGFAGPDGVNTILFDDPHGTFDDAFDCSGNLGSGPLAAAVGWTTPAERLYRGRPHRAIFEGDVVFNRNLACYFDRLPNPQGTANAIVGHELGHTLGFGHSSQEDPEPDAVLRDALMYFRARGELGRDVQVNADDRAAARALYGTGPPAAPTDLTAELVSDTEVALTWTDHADTEDSYRVERADGDGPFVQVIGFLPRDSEAVTVGDLVPGTLYRFRVRARNGAGFSGYSNVAEALPGLLGPPTDLRVVGLGESQVDLAWSHPGLGTVGFRVEIRSPAGTLEPQIVEPRIVDAGPGGAPPSDGELLSLFGLDAETPYTFQVRAVRGEVVSDPSAEVSVTTRAPGEIPGEGPGICGADEGTLCLLDGRFRVRVTWRDPRSGDRGTGRVAQRVEGVEEGPGSDLGSERLGSDASGLFWFFDAANLELIVKAIDGVGLNGFYWTFYGGLSDVEYWIQVLDTETGESVTYHNPPGEICGLADVRSFPRGTPVAPLPASASSMAFPVFPVFSSAVLPSTAAVSSESGAGSAGVSGSCVPGPTTLCLLDGRFQVEVEWENPRPPQDRGVGTVVPAGETGGEPGSVAGNTGLFWFFTPDNLELVVKVLDGRPVNGRFWVFYGALTDVGYRITVTDTVDEVTRVYENEPFNLCGDADVEAF